MKIINQVADDTLHAFGYDQWIEQFVKDVIDHARLGCEEVTIEDIEHSRGIFLCIDGREYHIRTWNFHPVEKDENDAVCAEMVDYTLYEMIKDAHGKHGNEASNGMVRINWKN